MERGFLAGTVIILLGNVLLFQKKIIIKNQFGRRLQDFVIMVCPTFSSKYMSIKYNLKK